VIYRILAGLYRWTVKGRRSLAETRLPVFALSFILALVYCITDEYHQPFNPERHATVNDMLIDAAGAILCLGLLYGIKVREKWMHKEDYCHGKTVDR
jgi:VanZ family protein